MSIIADDPWVLYADEYQTEVCVRSTVQMSVPEPEIFTAVDGFLLTECWEEEWTELRDSPVFLRDRVWHTQIRTFPECKDKGCGRFHHSHGYSEGVQWPSLPQQRGMIA